MISVEDKKQALLTALNYGLVQGMDVDVKGRGNKASRLKAGKVVRDPNVHQMFENLVQKVGEEKVRELIGQEERTPDIWSEQLIRADDPTYRLEQMILKLDAHVGKLEERIRVLEASSRHEELEEVHEESSSCEVGREEVFEESSSWPQLSKIGRPDEPLKEFSSRHEEFSSRHEEGLVGEKLLGFVLKEKVENGRSYWYASRWLDGQTKRVYIGKDKEKAEVKIQQWYARKGIEIPEVING